MQEGVVTSLGRNRQVPVMAGGMPDRTTPPTVSPPLFSTTSPLSPSTPPQTMSTKIRPPRRTPLEPAPTPPTAPAITKIFIRATIGGLNQSPLLGLHVDPTYNAIAAGVTAHPLFGNCVQRLFDCPEQNGRVAAIAFPQRGMPDLVVSSQELMVLVGTLHDIDGMTLTVFLTVY